MKKSLYLKTAILVVLSAGSLTACSGDNSFITPPPVVVAPPPPPPPPPPPTGQAAPQDSLGAGFKASFEQDRFAEPTDPVTSDIIPLDKTADAFDVPNPM